MSWIYASRVPSVRGCSNCGMLIHHSYGCKHMICQGCGHTKSMHQNVAAATVLKTLLSDHQGRGAVRDWWMTISGARDGRQTLDAHWRRAFRMSARSERHRWERSRSGSDAPALLRRGKILPWELHVVWKDKILVCGGADTSADRAFPEAMVQ